MAFGFLKAANNSSTTLGSTMTAGTTECKLISGGHTTFPATAPFDISIGEEILHVESIAGDTFTVKRAAQGTTAAEHATGAAVELRVTAKQMTDLNEAVNNIETGATTLTKVVTATIEGVESLIGKTLAITKVKRIEGEGEVSGGTISKFEKIEAIKKVEATILQALEALRLKQTAFTLKESPLNNLEPLTAGIAYFFSHAGAVSETTVTITGLKLPGGNTTETWLFVYNANLITKTKSVILLEFENAGSEAANQFAGPEALAKKLELLPQQSATFFYQGAKWRLMAHT